MGRVPLITGIGMVSPLAVGAAATWRALVEGAYIRGHARTPLDSSSPGRVHRLALAAAEEAVADAAWVPGAAVPGRTALLVGTSKGPVEVWMTAPPPSDNVAAAGAHAACALAAAISARLRASLPSLDGPSLTVTAACASGLHALIRAVMMIRSGEADRVLVVAAEASVHPLFLASFRRLGVLPREGVGCRPFDVDRDGFLMSEAAAAVCLEPSETPGPPRPYAAVDRFAFGGDAAHLTGSDPTGATLRRLLGAVVAGRTVDLVHAHGTGTVANDPVELAAIEASVVPGEPPSLYSHKGALGHSLGASGLLSVVLNCKAHRVGVVPPNVQTRTPLPSRCVRIERDTHERPVRRSVAIVAGFGGAMAAVSLSSSN